MHILPIIHIIEFGLQAKPSNLYREFVLLAAPRDYYDNYRDFFYNVLRLINVKSIAGICFYNVLRLIHVKMIEMFFV